MSLARGRNIEGNEAVRLLMRHERSLRSYLSLLFVSESDADDLIQEVSLLAWEKLADFRYQGDDPSDEFRAWLYTMAKFKVLNLRRKHSRQKRVTLSEQVIEELSAEVRLRASELDQRAEALQTCVSRLSGEQRELIKLRYGSQMSVDEIAGWTHRTSEAVYKAIQRIRRRLLDCVNRSLSSSCQAMEQQ